MSDGVERPPRAPQLVFGFVAAVLVAAMVVIGIGRLAGFSAFAMRSTAPTSSG